MLKISRANFRSHLRASPEGQRRIGRSGGCSTEARSAKTQSSRVGSRKFNLDTDVCFALV